MADLRYSVEVDTKKATASLNQLKSTASGVGTVLTGLFAAISVKTLINFADSITLVQNRLRLLAPTAEGVAKQFDALTAIAISARTPLEQTADLYFRIARNADQLGISQKEAAVITESVAKAISSSGLSAQEAAGPLLQLGQALQSGRFQGDELRSILEGLPPVARALANSLGVPIGALKELGAQGKISAQQFIIAMRQAKDAIEQDFARTVPTVGQAFENLQTTIAYVFNEFRKGSGEGTNLARIIEYLSAQIFFLSKNVDELIGPLVTTVKVIGALLAFSVVGRTIALVTRTVQLAAASFAGFATVLTKVGGAIAAFVGIDMAAESISKIGEEGTESAKKIEDFRKALAEMKLGLDDSAGAAQTYIQGIGEATIKETNNLEKIINQFKLRNAERLKGLELSRMTLGISERERAAIEATADVDTEYLKEKANLEQRIAELGRSSKEAEKAQIPQVQEALKSLTEEYQRHREAVQGAANALTDAQNARQFELYSIQRQIELEDDLMRIQDDIAKSTMNEIEKKYYDIERAAERSAKAAIRAEEARRMRPLTLEEQKKYYDEAVKGTEKLKEAAKVQYEQSRTFAFGWKRAMQEYIDDATNAARRAEQIFRKATSGMEDLIVNFVKTGKFEWKDFVAMMLEELLRAQIQTIFAQLLGSMQNSLTSTSGGFLDSIIGGVSSIFGGGENEGGGFLEGILGGIGSIFGGGSGGASGGSANNPIYVYDVSGGGGGGGGVLQDQGPGIIERAWEGIKEAGSSVWEGIKSAGKSVWGGISTVGGAIWDGVKSAGSAVSNVLGGVGSAIGSAVDWIGSGIGSVASGIGDFFSGFFANGGIIPSGKFGVVGENGPEFVSGPATVTPMTGSNVTYNINAVDALSFKQLLAQDPGYIYGLTMQGSKGVPLRR